MSTETLTVAPTGSELIQLSNDESFRDAAGGVWTSGRNGNRWQLVLTFANVSGATRKALMAHASQLRGQQNRLRVPISLLDESRTGAGGGTPLHVGAVTSGAASLSIDGATDTTDWLVGGDYCTIGNELKIVTQDVNTSGTAGTIQIWPEVHQNYLDNEPVDIVTPHGDFFLVEMPAFPGVPHPGGPLSPSVTFVLEEDVYA